MAEFDAVVIGEYERAFYGDQFREVVSRLNELGVEVWLPEAGGLVDLASYFERAFDPDRLFGGADGPPVFHADEDNVVGPVSVGGAKGTQGHRALG